jgi:hypothetical protein
MPEGGAAKALPLVMQGAGAAKSGGGGGKGGGSGGISPEQKALAQFTMGQQLLKQRSAFANSGLGPSTMSSYEGAGPRLAAAQQEAQQSDANQLQQQQQQDQLLKLAQQAQGQQGFGAGASAGLSNTGGTAA